MFTTSAWTLTGGANSRKFKIQAQPPGSDRYSTDSYPSIQTSDGGDFTPGCTLVCVLGNVPVQTWTYQWYVSDGTDEPQIIAGATGPTYTTNAGTASGKTFSVEANGSTSGAIVPPGQTIL